METYETQRFQPHTEQPQGPDGGSGAAASPAARPAARQPNTPAARTPAKAAKRDNAARPKKKITEAEFDQHLLKIGLISSLPDPALEIDDDDPDDQPVTIKGEPLSETIIRERR